MINPYPYIQVSCCQIQVEVCKTDVHRYCEKFSNIFPFPVEEQNCHFEPKKICELEMKTRPKKAKKYSYTRDCKEQPKKVYDQCEKKTLKPICTMDARQVCGCASTNPWRSVGTRRSSIATRSKR